MEYANRIVINFKSKQEPAVIFAKYDTDGYTNNDLAKMFADNLNSPNMNVQADRFITFNLGVQNFIFNKDEILSIQVDIVEQVTPNDNKKEEVD